MVRPTKVRKNGEVYCDVVSYRQLSGASHVQSIGVLGGGSVGAEVARDNDTFEAELSRSVRTDDILSHAQFSIQFDDGSVRRVTFQGTGSRVTGWLYND